MTNTPKPQATTLDEILNWRAKAVNEWRTNQAGIDPDFKYEFSDELFSRHREEAKQAIQTLITEARIDEIGKLHDDILMSENHIRALKKARACLTQLEEKL